VLFLSANGSFPTIAERNCTRRSVMGMVERAFQLAPSCRTIDELRAKLMLEGSQVSTRIGKGHCAEI
jgi:hypothetical protein